MRQESVWSRGFVWTLFVLAAQVNLGSMAAKHWAWDQVKSWTFAKKDARRQALWDNRKFLTLIYTEQTEQLIERLSSGDLPRRAALILLGQRPLEQWARAAPAEAS